MYYYLLLPSFLTSTWSWTVCMLVSYLFTRMKGPDLSILSD